MNKIYQIDIPNLAVLKIGIAQYDSTIRAHHLHRSFESLVHRMRFLQQFDERRMEEVVL